MRKKTIKLYRDKMINDFWNGNKAEWEMEEVAYLFSLSLAHLYKILKSESKGRSNNNNE